MKTSTIQIVIEVEKKIGENNDVQIVADDMSNDIQAYLESMKYAADDLWIDCPSITIKAYV